MNEKNMPLSIILGYVCDFSAMLFALSDSC